MGKKKNKKTQNASAEMTEKAFSADADVKTDESAPSEEAAAKETPAEEAAAKETPSEESSAGETAPAEETATAPAEETPAEGETAEKEESETGENPEPLPDADLVYKVLGPQSLFGHLLQMLVGTLPVFSVPFVILWAFLGGTAFSVVLISAPAAFALALLAYWAFGGCANVNRRRFARAWFLWVAVCALAIALMYLLAVSFGFSVSPVLKKILSPYLI